METLNFNLLPSNVQLDGNKCKDNELYLPKYVVLC